jgi:hypothetical protein
MDGAGPENDEEAGVFPGQDGADHPPGIGHKPGLLLAAGNLGEEKGGCRERDVLDDVQI